MVGFGWHGEARLGGVWLDEVRRGLLRLVRQCMFCLGMARCGAAGMDAKF